MPTQLVWAAALALAAGAAAAQELAPVRIAVGRWTGGTGKYEGIRREFEIRVRGLRPAATGFGHYIGTKQGSYRMAPPH
jgi:hypothetical protein